MTVEYESLVRRFMEKIDGVMDADVNEYTEPEGGRALLTAASLVESVRAMLHQKYLSGNELDARLIRAELVMDEVAEFCEALAAGTEVDVADALADLLYVTFGGAIAFGIPIDHVFAEVHRSNMTKSATARGHAGTKGKEEGYEAPDIKRAIAEGRKDRA